MLTNFDLMDIAKHYKINLIDVVMKDELPKRVKNGNYIINYNQVKMLMDANNMGHTGPH